MLHTPAITTENAHGRNQSATELTCEEVRFGVVLPIHDEEELVRAALDALDRAIDHAVGSSVRVAVAIVLDACRDGSRDVVMAWHRRALALGDSRHVDISEIDVGNVGTARGVGCAALLDHWSGAPLETIWLATTDADSEVPPDWITAQLRMRRERAQLWAGVVRVEDWADRLSGTAEAWLRDYAEEHGPIHGANFGIDALLYLRAGGFEGLPTGEDRALFHRAVALGATVGYDPAIQVVTSARREARAPLGFAHALASIEAALATRPLAPLGRQS